MSFELIRQGNKLIISLRHPMQGRKDYPSFNIRKVNKRALKNPQELGLFTPQYEYEKYPETHTFTNPKKEKQIIIDQSVNQAILASKPYTDLKTTYLQTKRKNAQRKQQLLQEVQALHKQKAQAAQQSQRLEAERTKFQQLLNDLKERIMEVRRRNHQARDYLQSRMNNEAEYLSNLLISMRFQAQYEHDIDPDQMTYEELLQLGEKIGTVSRGLPAQLLQKLPTIQLTETMQQQCMVCCCQMQAGEIITSLPPCKHSFHRQCVMGWLSKQKQCPLCKQEVVLPSE